MVAVGKSNDCLIWLQGASTSARTRASTTASARASATVTGPPGALLFDVKPEIALKESLELQF